MERSEFWGIYPFLIQAFRVLEVIALLVFFSGSYKKLKIWAGGLVEEGELEGKPSVFGLAALSLSTLFSSGCLLAKRSFRISTGRAIILIAIKWSFLLLLLGSISVLLNVKVFDSGLLTGDRFIFFKAVLNWAGIFFIIGVVYAIVRRFFSNMVTSSGYDYFLLFLLLTIAVSSFIMQGLRFTVASWSDEAYSPLGLLFKHLCAGMTMGNAMTAYNAVWALHALLALFFVAYIPYSKIFHIFAAQITTAAAKRRERAAGIA